MATRTASAGSRLSGAPGQLTPREINDLYRRLDGAYLCERSVARPSKLYVAVSAVCDVACPFCPRQYFARNELNQGLFPVERFARIARHAGVAEYCGLFGEGEPFCHPRFFEFVREVKAAGGPAATSTHGMSLTAEAIELLIEHQVDLLAVSMDAPERRLFNYLREGADFDVVCDNVRRLVARRRERGSALPELVIACTVSRRNMDWLEEMAYFAHRLGAQELTFADLAILDPRHAHLSVRNHPRFRRRLGRAQAVARNLGLRCEYYPQNPYLWIKPETRRWEGPSGCPELWRTYSVGRTGKVLPCCFLEESFGDAFEEELDALANHPVRLEFRRAVMGGTPHPTCAGCDYLEPNTPERAAGILNEVEAALDDERLPAGDRQRLRALVDERRELARTFFGANCKGRET